MPGGSPGIDSVTFEFEPFISSLISFELPSQEAIKVNRLNKIEKIISLVNLCATLFSPEIYLQIEEQSDLRFEVQ